MWLKRNRNEVFQRKKGNENIILKIIALRHTFQSSYCRVAIASKAGITYLQNLFPNVDIWVGAIDEELTAKSYIVPGLGDAGDLVCGEKLQN